MSDKRICVSNPDWTIKALSENAERDIKLQLLRREQPIFRLAYIARRRAVDVDHGWNWCGTCHIEIPVWHIHDSAVQCPNCMQRFLELHEGTEANQRLRVSPGYAGPYHDMLSAAWHEWSLRPVGKHALPDGALAFDVTPFALPFRSVYAGTRSLTPRERRRLARHGHRGRRGSVRVSAIQDVYQREEYEPEVIREHRAERCATRLDARGPLEETRMKVVELRRTRLRYRMHICKFCSCDLRIFGTVYIEQDAPHLMALIERGLQRAGVVFATSAMRQELCFCVSGIRAFSA